MKTEVSFMYEGNRYYTVTLSDYAMSTIGSNAIMHSALLQSKAISSDWRRRSKYHNQVSAPIVQLDNISFVNNMFEFTGKVTMSDGDYTVTLKDKELTYTPMFETTEEVVEPEPAPTPEPEPEPAPTPEPEPAPEPTPIVKEPVVKESVDVKEEDQDMRMRGFQCERATRVNDDVGLQFGRRDANTKVTGLQLGNIDNFSNPGFTTNENVGCVFNRLVRREMPKPVMPKPVQKVEPEESYSDLQKSWRQAVAQHQAPTPVIHTPDAEPVVTMPVVEEPVVEEPVVEDAKSERDKLKAAVRESLPSDINAIIGDIPVEMLGSIAEYTSNPVDVKTLSEQKDLFCIDKRWHKQGKWFCIDVVCNTSRYFFNSRRNVSIEIPIQYLKDWLNAIS